MEMGRIKRFIQIISFAAFFVTQSLHGQQHSHDDAKAEKEDDNGNFWIKDAKPQHGGELVNAGKYKLEIVSSLFQINEKISVYVFKGKKEIDIRDAKASALLKYKDGRVEHKNMQIRNGKLVLDTLQLSPSVNIEFKIYLNDKVISGIYYYPGVK